MRTLRVSLAGTVILGLLASLSLLAVAQTADEPESPTATYVTGVAVSEREGGDYSEWEMDWSDPRLPSRMLGRFSAETGPPSLPA
jgi:hypothetical protein